MTQDQATSTILNLRNSGSSWNQIGITLEMMVANGAISKKSAERLHDAYSYYRDVEGRYGTLYPVKGKDY